jgi:predicted esterase
MHAMAKACTAAGHPTFALDIRGHGASGRKGQIAYIGAKLAPACGGLSYSR